jgi:SAM-dependent methyltransferase
VGVLHHLPDAAAALANLLRCLKPGGEVQIYLYWQPEAQPVKGTLLAAVSAMRQITTHLPHRLLYWLSYPAAAAAHAAFVTPYRVLRAIPGMQAVAETVPMRQYASYPFRVCVNDQFDRFSAPIEHRYSAAQVRALLEETDLEDISVLPNWGWLGSGRKRGAERPLHPHAPVSPPLSPLKAL